MPAIGDWSELLAGPPSERLHQTATYDPVRKRVIVFGGLAHVWVHGDLSYLSLDKMETWHHIESDVSPSPRWGHTAVHDPVRDRILVFGGTGAHGPRRDVWALALDTFAWTELRPFAPGPTARFAHAAVYDPSGDRMIVFGGYDGRFRNDVWELSLRDEVAWKQLAPAGASPPTLDAAAADYDPVRRRMIVFGGFDGSTSRNDVWALSLDRIPTWSQIVPGGEPPAIRRQHMAIYDPVRDRLVVFGGTAVTEGPGYDDVWALSLGSSPRWQRLTPAGTAPTRRWGHSLLYDAAADRALVFGGVDLVDWRNDTWELGLSNPAWKPLGGSTPAARWGHASVLDTRHDRLLVCMGAGQSRWLQDVWALDLSGPTLWQPLSVNGTPPHQRQDASAVHDAKRERLILYGGRTWYPFDDHVWELALAGTPAWRTLEARGDPPAERSAHTALFDALRDRMLVFGGFNHYVGQLNELWALSLSGIPTWSEIQVRGPIPDARQNHSAVYDAARGRMIVFGGFGAGQVYDDVWALSPGDSPRWTRIATTDSPGPRWGHAAVWDAAHDRMIVFGGDAPDGSARDTWSLAFATDSGERAVWTELNPGGLRPIRRGGHSAVLDASRNRMLVFGGQNEVAFLDDTSALDLGPVKARASTPSLAPHPGTQLVSIGRVAVEADGAGVQADVRFTGRGIAKCHIVDVRGRRVAERLVEVTTGERNLEFDLGMTPRGIYWLRIEHGGRVVSARFVRLHR